MLQTGFTPIFVDIDLNTLGMDNNKVIEAITPKTKAVFLSHIQGFNGLKDLLDAWKNVIFCSLRTFAVPWSNTRWT